MKNKHSYSSIFIFILLAVIAHRAVAGNNIIDDFTGVSAQQKWYAFNGACLTAGNNTGSIPACEGLQYYSDKNALPQVGIPTGGDLPGHGALRLTNGGSQGTGENGAIISTTTYPSNEGLQITFTTYTYGGNSYSSMGTNPGADGIGFYLLNGAPTAGNGTTTLSNIAWDPSLGIGAFGGSLGYSCSNTNNPSGGMPGAYLGLGIDEFGNFLNQSDNTNTGIDGVKHPGEIGIRGYGNVTLAALQKINPNATGNGPNSDVYNVCKNGGVYTYDDKTYHFPDYNAILTNTTTGQQSYKILDSSTPISNESATTRLDATPITYKLIITSDGKLSLSYVWGKNTSVNVINQQDISQSNGPLPSSFYFGFGASTGGGTNVHEITCFEASPSTRATGAPIAPVSVSGGSLVYSITSNPDPVAGHVQAFQTVSTPTSSASAPIGTATGKYVWDAGDSAHMSEATRADALRSTGPTPTGSPMGSGPVPLLSALDTAAFNLSTTNPPSCVPDIATIISYTTNPNYSSGSCSYLAGRQAGWMLGGINPNDSARYLGAPGNAALLALPGYVTFARNNNKRAPQLLFTSDDGFLYSVDALSGNLTWGWMPRPFVSKLQNYSGFEGLGNFNGGFTVTDAVSQSPSPNTWNTYVVGTAQGGAYHYALQLSSNTSATSTTAPQPTAQSWGIGTCPTGATCRSPQMQAPVIATFNGNQYAIFIVNASTTSTKNGGATTSTTSTLYEVNVATGGSTTGTVLPFTSNSAITYVPSTGTLWIGDAAGNIWSLNVSGSASSDAGSAILDATTSPAAPINYVGYTEINGIAYMWAATSTQISTFRLSGATGSLIWSSTGGSTPSSSASGVNTLQLNGTISAAPAFVNGVLIVPVYVPPTSSCALVGTGYYDLFDLLSGGLPKIPITYKNNAITSGVVNLGQGIPYTPSVSVTNSGTVVYPGNSLPPSSQNPISPINFGGSVMNKPIAWRQY